MENEVYTLFDDMLAQTHLLVAGATGSGKSVVINGMIFNAIHEAPKDVQFILIDPKRVELSLYRNLPHVLRYASEPDEMIGALHYALQVIERRYDGMQAARKRKYTGSHIYIIIDELADLMTTARKQVQPLIQRICQIGRAASVSVVAATQCPLSEVIPTPIAVNFDSRVALRTRNAQDSRNIMGVSGCETLPRYGRGFFVTPEGTELYEIPMYSDEEIIDLVEAWEACGAAVTRDGLKLA